MWRRIEKGHVRTDNGKVICKPGAFRLQVSLVRAKYGQESQVCEGKWNGIAESDATKLSAMKVGNARVVCVDDPLSSSVGHALAAVVLEPGAELGEKDLESAARNKFAVAFKVTLVPT